MKKLLGIVVLGLLMISCSEDNSTSKNNESSEMNKYLNNEISSKLMDIQISDRLNNENSPEDNLKLFAEPSVFRMYSLIGGTIVFCHSWEESYKSTNSSDTKSEFLENMNKGIEKKCKIFRDFHCQYDSVFKQIANTKKIPPFYFLPQLFWRPWHLSTSFMLNLQPVSFTPRWYQALCLRLWHHQFIRARPRRKIRINSLLWCLFQGNYWHTLFYRMN